MSQTFKVPTHALCRFELSFYIHDEGLIDENPQEAQISVMLPLDKKGNPILKGSPFAIMQDASKGTFKIIIRKLGWR